MRCDKHLSWWGRHHLFLQQGREACEAPLRFGAGGALNRFCLQRTEAIEAIFKKKAWPESVWLYHVADCPHIGLHQCRANR
jgi:hypothetical protein